MEEEELKKEGTSSVNDYRFREDEKLLSDLNDILRPVGGYAVYMKHGDVLLPTDLSDDSPSVTAILFGMSNNHFLSRPHSVSAAIKEVSKGTQLAVILPYEIVPWCVTPKSFELTVKITLVFSEAIFSVITRLAKWLPLESLLFVMPREGQMYVHRIPAKVMPSKRPPSDIAMAFGKDRVVFYPPATLRASILAKRAAERPVVFPDSKYGQWTMDISTDDIVACARLTS